MVMTPEPFGEAFDALEIDGATVVVPTPSGAPFSQALARELSTRERLVFLCGRYEGIDQRVLDHAATRAEVVEVSLGDYVLNGGEVAAMAVTEAVVRLLPGFMGNAESLVEESHEDGLLEYPVYTRPASWRGLDVPPVLLSGDHAAVAAWRLEEARRRTAQRRPDLLHPSLAATEWEIVPAPARRRRRAAHPPAGLLGAGGAGQRQPRRHPGAARVARRRAGVDGGPGRPGWYAARAGWSAPCAASWRDPAAAWDIGRIMVAPDLQGRGLGRALLAHIEAVAAPEATSYLLFTGARSADNIRMYKKAGYRVRTDLDAPPLAVILTKSRR